VHGGLLLAQPAWFEARTFRALESSLNMTRITSAREIAITILFARHCRAWTRQSIFFFVMRGLDPRIHPLSKSLRREMDTRIKPAYDAAGVAASSRNSSFKFQTAKRLRSRAAARV
jgi:hypothetical protein